MGTLVATGPTTRIGRLIAERREQARLTQEALGEKIGVSRETVSAIENGRTKVPEPALVNKIARVLPVTVKELTRAIGYALEEDDALLDEIMESERQLLSQLQQVITERSRKRQPNGGEAPAM